MKQKFYCYVDETGQDTKGTIFIVSVILTADSQGEMAEFIRKIEKSSGKSQFKWGRSNLNKRLRFIQEIFNQGKNMLSVYYSIYKNTTEYKNATVLTIAKSVNTLEDFKNHTFNIYVDGLSKKDGKYYGSQLHHLSIHTKKVKGVKKDQNNPMIRLADSMCGFVRDIIFVEQTNSSVIKESTDESEMIFRKAVKDKVLIEV